MNYNLKHYAYIGDCVWELFVREIVITKTQKQDVMHKLSTKFVNAQAQADIAEDGYWGVNQTSDRIVDFAKALTGGDPNKIEEMREAFKKGFKQAEEKWGGELPEISQKTYDAVLEKFDAWAAETTQKAEESTTIV